MSYDHFKASTSKFTVIKILYEDQDGFVVAIGTWADTGEESIGVRWASEGIGYPQTHGHPQWFIMNKPWGNIMVAQMQKTQAESDLSAAITEMVKGIQK